VTATMPGQVSPDLRTTLRALKLGQMPGTLPERLTLARQQKMPHADFLELILADEVTRREAKSAGLRARAAGLDPVGVGKTHLASALGHIAVRRRRTVHMAPASKLFKRLKAARLDNTLEAEMRRLAGVELLILDDFALQPLDATETADFYQLCVERHRKTSTVVTSNRTPEEWLSMMADPLLAQSAVDRLASTAHELIIEGQSYRHRQKPSLRSAASPDPGGDDGAA